MSDIYATLVLFTHYMGRIYAAPTITAPYPVT